MKKTILHLTTVGIIAVTGFTSNAQSWSVLGNAGTNVITNFVGTTDNKGLVFRTNNLERMRITASGMVGIGTTGPQALLHVPAGAGVSLSSTDNFLLGRLGGPNIAFDNNEIQARFNGGGSTLYLNYWGGAVWMGNRSGASTPAIYASTNGSAGIGSSTVEPGFALTINPFATGGAIYINDPLNGNLGLGTKSGSTGEGFRMNISSTTNPFAAIRGHTDGNGYGVVAEATGQFGMGAQAYSTQSYGLWAGTGDATTYAAYFSGDIFCSGDYLGSDEKLKQNIQEFSSALDIINQLHPKRYQFRGDGDYKLMNLPRGEHYGLVAQDVEKLLPNLVKNTKFYPGKAVPSKGESLNNEEIIEFKALNYTELIPVMIKAMQEQQAMILEQRQQIREQQQQIDDLKKAMQTPAVSRNDNLAGSLINSSLQQNTPNPFRQNTTIQCNIPSSAKKAQLIVYNSDGRQVRSFSLNSGTNNITIAAGTLLSGHYSYSLLIDGKKIDSKSMILAK